uniref:Secreted protein n=1 Tax=Astyanax mexicanus TaxID=7994 RepID=A0A3B1KIV0_ASTMX
MSWWSISAWITSVTFSRVLARFSFFTFCSLEPSVFPYFHCSSIFSPLSPLNPGVPLNPIGPMGPLGPGSPFGPRGPTKKKIQID